MRRTVIVGKAAIKAARNKQRAKVEFVEAVSTLAACYSEKTGYHVDAVRFASSSSRLKSDGTLIYDYYDSFMDERPV